MPHGKHSGRKKGSSSNSIAYGIDMTASAEEGYMDLARKAKAAERNGNYASAHIASFNMVRDAIKKTIANDPLNKKYGLRDELSNMFRLRKGRLRICWIASSRMHRVCILFISETVRKEGDASDPYVIFQNMVDAGKFDTIFQQFGVRMDRLRPHGRSSKPR